MHPFHCDRPKLFRDLLDHFGVDVDVNVVADAHAAVVHSGVPFHAEVLTINLGGGVHGGALIAPRIFYRGGRSLYIQNNLPGITANGEIAGYFEFAWGNLLDLGGFERHGGEVIDVKEMITAEILVAGRFASVDSGYVNRDIYRGLGDVQVID